MVTQKLLPVQARRVGYWASWATGRNCATHPISSIDPHMYTDLMFSFAQVNENFELAAMASSEYALYTEFVKLKQRNPQLRVHLAVGGWAFNDPPTGMHLQS
jgi:GH18 family chitinase